MIDKITIAAGALDEMAAFYQRVLGVDLTATAAPFGTMYRGAIGGLEVLLCPKEVAGVEATNNTIQLRFVVPDTGAALASALAAGGTALEPVASRNGRLHASFRDPDGNSVEVIEPPARPA